MGSTIEECLQKGKTLIEVLEIAKKLKRQGADIMEVNAAITKRRRQLVVETRPVTTITKVAIPMLVVPSVVSTHLPLTIKNLKSNKLIIRDGAFEL